MSENKELLELEETPIRKITLGKSSERMMVYEVGRIYGRGKFEVTSIEFGNNKYYVFINEILKDGGIDDVSMLWKVETSPEISAEYDLTFMTV